MYIDGFFKTVVEPVVPLLRNYPDFGTSGCFGGNFQGKTTTTILLEIRKKVLFFLNSREYLPLHFASVHIAFVFFVIAGLYRAT